MRQPVAGERFPGIDVVDAYEIQLRGIRRRVANGASVYGHKVGLPSEAMQQTMGVNEPEYGHLLQDMVLSEDEPVRASRYLLPRVEVEVPSCSGRTCPPRAAPWRTCCARPRRSCPRSS